MAVLPPHTTHWLQPLDVGIFSPLSNAYTKQLDDWLEASYDMTGMQKQEFWRLFNSAWTEALTEKNILSAFEATEIQPINSSRVLQKIKKPKWKSAQLLEETPCRPAAYRDLMKMVHRDPRGLRPDIRQALRGGLKAATDHELVNIQACKIFEAHKQSKQRKAARSRPAGLFNPEQEGQAQFFSPGRVAAVRQAAEEAQVQKA